MAKKLKPGQKRCPSCGTAVSGPRTKLCPKCGHEFNAKPQKGPAPETARARVAAAKPTKPITLDKPQVNKTQAVREYLKDHPGALSSKIAADLNKQGIEITAGYVAGIKTMINKTHAAKKEAAVVAAAPATPAVPAAPAIVEKPTKNGDTITLEQVKKVAQTVKTMGGYQRMIEVLDVIKAAGGVKKFRELAEAMTVTEPDVVVF